MKNSYSFFNNKECEYFPCHKGIKKEEFNCMFCYCPLYCLGTKCGGNPKMLDNGIKDCSGCILPHRKGGYETIVSRYQEIAEMAFKNK